MHIKIKFAVLLKSIKPKKGFNLKNKNYAIIKNLITWCFPNVII